MKVPRTIGVWDRAPEECLSDHADYSTDCVKSQHVRITVQINGVPGAWGHHWTGWVLYDRNGTKYTQRADGSWRQGYFMPQVGRYGVTRVRVEVTEEHGDDHRNMDRWISDANEVTYAC